MRNLGKPVIDINVDDDGIVTAASLDLKRCEEAIEIVRAITLEPEVGMEFDGSVTRLMTFGAFVEFAQVGKVWSIFQN